MSALTLLNRTLPRPIRPVEIVSRRYLRTTAHVVQSGPFRGLKYIERAHCSALVPKIAGTYEQELLPFLPRLFDPRPDVFIDVGAAEGYYAVGVVFRNWVSKVIAFEAEAAARESCRELMALNGISDARLEIREACTPERLQDLLARQRNAALMIDAEGFECFLLDPMRVPDLGRCRMLVEYHAWMIPGLLDQITERMSGTHVITRIEQSSRETQDLESADPVVRLFPRAIRRRALSEQRPFSDHGWLWLTPRT